MPTGNLDYVRSSNVAQRFYAVYQRDARKWIVLFWFSQRGQSSGVCQVFTRLGNPKTFTLGAIYKMIKRDTEESTFTTVFDPDVSNEALVAMLTEHYR